MTEFASRYRHLNANQKKAVDTIDGPVMVVAGPGTGKTELLSVRAANILNKTDASPRNILCLTYTESGAAAMRERMAELIGPEAYKIAVHTFHSFGSEIINRYGEYFYHGAHFRPSDELSTYEVLCAIFEKLPHDNPLASRMNGQFTHLNDTQTAISDLKKSGLTPDELLQILDRNEAFIAWLEPRLEAAFGPRLSKKQLPNIAQLSDEVGAYQDEPLALINYQPLHELMHTSLERALEAAEVGDTTTPVSEWKRAWVTKKDDGLTIKDAKRSHKLRAVAGIYYDYLRAMQERALFDFDDMILRVVHAMEIFAELRYELQEQYQYIMVDEFQDTNDAQMRLVWNLTNAASNEGRPNLLIVGDDDQAIYRFQGATLSNILSFERLYRDVAVIPLTDNYRSHADILALARSVITQADERLETVIEGLDKTLTPHHQAKQPKLSYQSLTTAEHEFSVIAEQLAADIKRDPTRSRAVIARRHYQLVELLPYLTAKDIPLRYDRQQNILDTEPIQQLELVSRIVNHIAHQRISEANASLPELLAHPAWQIDARDLWQLSLTAQTKRTSWLEVMLETPGRFADTAEWLLVSAQKAQHTGLEPMLDWLFGTVNPQLADDEQADDDQPFQDGPHEAFVSPLRTYFFPSDCLEKRPGDYLRHLSALSMLHAKLREYRPDTRLRLDDMVNFLNAHHELGLAIPAAQPIGESEGTVELLTAHKAKGLEYDEIYVIGLTDAMWGEKARTRSRMVAFPGNLPLGFDTDTTDEKLRLLYVALTRAKEQLHLSTHRELSNNKTVLPVGYLDTGHITPIVHEAPDAVARITMAETDWRSKYLSVDQATMRQLLTPALERYRLSATHLNHYLDVSRGGPELFLLQNLLRFPQAMTPSAAYGSAVHAVLQRAHTHFRAVGKRRPVEDLLGNFDEELQKYQLSDADYELYQHRGSNALTTYFEQRYDSFAFTQVAECSFSSDDIRIGPARITGAIDLIDVDEDARTIIVTDYKTGKAVGTWKGRTEYEKIKLHHYRQQLMLYKLLLENSRQFDGYTVTKGVIEFVEPDSRGRIQCLELEYDADELATMHQLLQAVWGRIIALDFSLPTDYPATLSGIKEFEQSLISGSH